MGSSIYWTGGSFYNGVHYDIYASWILLFPLHPQINGHCDVVDYILDNGADVNQLDDSGTSVLSACHHVAYSSHPKVGTIIN